MTTNLGSSIVKWFFDEPFEDLARNTKDKAKISFTSLIAFSEVMSVINRAWKYRRCKKIEMEMIRSEFEFSDSWFHDEGIS